MKIMMFDIFKLICVHNIIMCKPRNLWLLICYNCVFEGWNLHIGHGYMPPKILPACGTLMNLEEIY